MKSAWELALERSGGELRELSGELKAELNEIDRKYKAKIAEAELSAGEKEKKIADDPEKLQELQEGLLGEIASLRDRAEREKQAARQRYA